MVLILNDGWMVDGRYYIAMTEFIWEVLDPREDGKVVTIMDVKGIGIKDLYGEALEFLRTASDLMQVSSTHVL